MYCFSKKIKLYTMKIKLIIAITAISLCLSSYTFSKSVVIIKVLNKQNYDFVLLLDSKNYILNEYNNSFIIPTDTINNTYRYEIENKSSDMLYLMKNFQHFNIFFISPNDSLYIEFDFNDINNTIIFKGKNAIENKFTLDYYKYFDEKKLESNYTDNFKLEYKDFIKYYDSLRISMERYLTENYKNNNQDFINYYKGNFKYMLPSIIENYVYRHSTFKNSKYLFNSIEDSLDFCNRLFSKDTLEKEYCLSIAYIMYMSKKMENKIDNLKQEDKIIKLKNEYERYKSKNALDLYEKILSKTIEMSIYTKSYFKEDFVNYFKNTFPNSNYNEYLMGLLKKYPVRY